MSTRSVAYKNDISAYLRLLIMTLVHIFTSFSFPEHNSVTIRNILMSWGRGLVDRKLFEAPPPPPPPSNFIAGRPTAALLFWFLGDFRCGALLFMVIHVIYKYKNR